MLTNPLVSIIIPLYNSEKFIIETINSALNQTYKNIEIIIVDDGSTDNSRLIVKELNNTKIRLISVPNGGASKARNIGIKNANGMYVQFLDADDILSENKIEEQVKLFETNKQIDLCFCRTIVFTFNKSLITNQEVNSEIFTFETISGNQLLALLLGKNNKVFMILQSAYLVKKSILTISGLWDETLSLDDDGEFFSRVLNCSKIVAYDKKGINYYRKYHTKNSLSQQTGFKYMTSEILAVKKKLSTIKNGISLTEFYKIQKVQFSLIKYKYFKELHKIDFINIDYELSLVGGFEVSILPTRKGRILMKIIGYNWYFIFLKFLNQINIFNL